MQTRATLAIVLLLMVVIVASCGEPDEPSQQGAEPQITASPGELTAPQHNTVDMAPLDNPEHQATVYWLGHRFDPGGGMPPLELEFVAGPAPPGGGPEDSQGELQYSIADANEPVSGVTLRLWKRSDWETWLNRDPAASDMAAIFHMFWNSPCAENQDVQMDAGEAVVFRSYRALADPAVTECPARDFDRFLGHAFFDNTVVTVNAPFYLEPPDSSPYPSAYNSVEGVMAVLQGLQQREAVIDPTPLPTRTADLADPGSLVLQEADLPGRYSYGDDGCAPGRDCFIGPTRLGSEGQYDDLAAAVGEVLIFSYQFEHVGFSMEGTPDPAVEPPTIYSRALVCVSGCDSAAVLSLGSDLLAHAGFTEAEKVSTPLDLGDEADIYTVNTLVLGQVEPGSAVVWRHGPVVGLVVVGGVAGEDGHRIAIELARAQNARIERALTE